jgi:hypothetical protein
MDGACSIRGTCHEEKNDGKSHMDREEYQTKRESRRLGTRIGIISGLISFLICSACYAPVYNPNVSLMLKDNVGPDSKTIVSFSFAAPSAVGSIDEPTHSIMVTVPFGTDRSSLIPAIRFTGRDVEPASGVAQNFNGPRYYTVCAIDGTKQQYSVSVNLALSDEKDITSFVFTQSHNPTAGWASDCVGSIVGTNINVTVPYGTNRSSLIPIFTTTGASVWIGALMQTSGSNANDFSGPVSYTVYAADSSAKIYTVTVSLAAPPGLRITAAVNGGLIWSTADAGATWYSGGSSQGWTGIAGSADGLKMVATYGYFGVNSPIYRSVDGGASWTTLSAASLAYGGLSSNDDGTILGASVYDGSQNFYYSTDSGNSWSNTVIAGYQWWSIPFCSSDGLSWVMENGGDAAPNVVILRAHFDGSSSWSWTTTPYTASGGADYPKGYSISKDGQKLFVSYQTHMHYSLDFGSTWNPVASPLSNVSASAMSGDGNTLAVINSSALYTSTDNGTTWLIRTNGLPALTNPDTFSAPALSYDGSEIALYSRIVGNGYIYVSTNGGATFTQQTGPAASGYAAWNSIFMQQ